MVFLDIHHFLFTLAFNVGWIHQANQVRDQRISFHWVGERVLDLCTGMRHCIHTWKLCSRDILPLIVHLASFKILYIKMGSTRALQVKFLHMSFTWEIYPNLELRLNSYCLGASAQLEKVYFNICFYQCTSNCLWIIASEMFSKSLFCFDTL